jgi:hypothetical protein
MNLRISNLLEKIKRENRYFGLNIEKKAIWVRSEICKYIDYARNGFK